MLGVCNNDQTFINAGESHGFIIDHLCQANHPKAYYPIKSLPFSCLIWIYLFIKDELAHVATMFCRNGDHICNEIGIWEGLFFFEKSKVMKNEGLVGFCGILS